MRGACSVVDFQKHRVAKLMREACEHQADLARTLRSAADDRARLAVILTEAQQE